MNLIKKIGIGTVQFGMDYGISNNSGRTSTNEVKLVLEHAKKAGVIYIDTASAYGNSEEVLGKNNLSEFKIVSKFIDTNDSDKIEDQLNKSLSKLNINSIYGYLAHRPMELIENQKKWEELLLLKQQNKINKIGFSLNSPNELDLLLQENIMPDLIQVPYNYFDTRFKDHMIDLKEKGCEIHTRSTFLQGLFFIDVKKLSPFFDKVKKEINELQNTFKGNLSSVLLKYVLSLDFIDVVIMGVDNEKQLKDNLNNMASTELLAYKEFNFPSAIIMPSNWPK